MFVVVGVVVRADECDVAAGGTGSVAAGRGSGMGLSWVDFAVEERRWPVGPAGSWDRSGLGG